MLDKKLLITCLQFLNNLIARNEQRKLLLWIELFDSHLENELPSFDDIKYKMDLFPHLGRSTDLASDYALEGMAATNGLDVYKNLHQPASSPFLLYIAEVGPEVKKIFLQRGEKAGSTEIVTECRSRWQTMTKEEKDVRTPTGKCNLVILTDIYRNGTYSTLMSLPDIAMSLLKIMYTKRSLTDMQRMMTVYRLSPTVSTNFR